MKVSIVILTKNGREYIRDVLDKVTKQRLDYDFEVIVIDSGSLDGTLDILKDYPIRLYKIQPVDFSHSKTRNFGVSLALGEYIVFLSQDAVPISEAWLGNLIEFLANDKSTGASFGRQVPPPGLDPLNAFRLQWIYNDNPEIKDGSLESGFSRKTFSFSDVNSAVRKDLLTRFPFDVSLNFCEDTYLAKQLIANGYKIAYCPNAAVYHGHNHSLLDVFRRYFDIAIAYRRIGILGKIKGIEGEGGKYAIEELKYLARHGYWLWIPVAFINNLVKYIGFKLGEMEGFLPLPVKKAISKYWFNHVKEI
jgi:rhamnosyltransferase